jgi:hypothetical protein
MRPTGWVFNKSVTLGPITPRHGLAEDGGGGGQTPTGETDQGSGDRDTDVGEFVLTTHEPEGEPDGEERDEQGERCESLFELGFVWTASRWIF